VRYWVANTDSSWVSYLTSVAPIDEVNFWQPNMVRPITLPEGAPWLFKLHVRNDAVVRRFFTAQSNPELRTIAAMAEALDADIKIVPRRRAARRRATADMAGDDVPARGDEVDLHPDKVTNVEMGYL
jgi:hypothetical protein